MKSTLAIAFLSFTFCQCALAQLKPQEFVDAGWQKVSKDQITQAVTKFNQLEINLNVDLTTYASLKLKNGGDISGYAGNLRGRTGMMGKWRIEDEGDLCVDAVIVFSNQRIDACFSVFTLDGKTKLAPLTSATSIQKAGDLTPAI